jgi:alpha-ketoglutarate-dependent taurine dioxygenase
MSYDADEESELKFKAGSRKVVRITQEALVESALLDPIQGFPLLFKPVLADVDLEGWANNHQSLIESVLLKHGAILFRGFEINSIARFTRFVRSISPQLISYDEPTTPRSVLIPGVYTSTDYPASQFIQFHNELSYARCWPLKIWFGCLTAPAQGGETPIADSRKVFASLSDQIKKRFMRKKVMYVRNYGYGLGLPWQKVFQTRDKTVVEERCRRSGMSFEWTENDNLRTRQVSQACLHHPKTGEMLWFNQAHVHHLSSLDQSLRETLLAVSETAENPLDINACYGDGSAIEPAVIEQIHQAYREASVTFTWQDGDILMLDNMLMAHARAPFAGARRVVVAMAEPFDGDQDDEN